MHPFEFATAQQILFGRGKIEQLPAIAALMRNTADLFEYLEVIGKGRPLEHQSALALPCPPPLAPVRRSLATLCASHLNTPSRSVCVRPRADQTTITLSAIGSRATK